MNGLLQSTGTKHLIEALELVGILAHMLTEIELLRVLLGILDTFADVFKGINTSFIGLYHILVKRIEVGLDRVLVLLNGQTTIKLIDSFGLYTLLLRLLTSDFSDKRSCRILKLIKGKSGEYTSHTSHLGTTTTQELSVKGVVLSINGSDLQQGVLINDGSATTGLTSYLITNLEHTRTTGSGRGRSHRNGRRSLSHRNSRGGGGGSSESVVVNGLHSCSPF